MRTIVAVLAMLIAGVAWGQTGSSVTDAGGIINGVYGGGSSGSINGGGYFGIYSSGGPKGLPHGGVMIEMGGVGSGLYRLPEGQFSLEGMAAYNLMTKAANRRRPLLLVGEAGYSIYFVDGSALNYGGGFLWQYDREGDGYFGVRVVYRETWFMGRGNVGSIRVSHEWGGGMGGN